ncbi:unnamed protein product, partial [Wuchereria bancrofti]
MTSPMKRITFAVFAHTSIAWHACMLMSTKSRKRSLPYPSVLRCQQKKLSTPTSTVQRVNRSSTPNPQRDNQTNSLRNYELQSRRSKSVGRYVESQNGMEQPYQRSSENLNRESEEWGSGWRHELGAASCC